MAGFPLGLHLIAQALEKGAQDFMHEIRDFMYAHLKFMHEIYDFMH